MANDVVDAGAAARGKSARLSVIAELRRHMTVIAGIGFDQLVDLAGGQARTDDFADLVHELALKRAGLAHALAFGGREQQTAAVIEHGQQS